MIADKLEVLRKPFVMPDIISKLTNPMKNEEEGKEETDSLDSKSIFCEVIQRSSNHRNRAFGEATTWNAKTEKVVNGISRFINPVDTTIKFEPVIPALTCIPDICSTIETTIEGVSHRLPRWQQRVINSVNSAKLSHVQFSRCSLQRPRHTLYNGMASPAPFDPGPLYP